MVGEKDEHKRSVLIVEDDPLVSELLAKAFRLEGYEVDVARDGEEGLRKAQGGESDLILLDILLPGIDGWEVLTQLRRNPRSKDTPVIMVSALADEKSRIQGLRGGADDYVTKPFSTLELLARVEAVLRRIEGKISNPSPNFRLPVRKGEKIHLLNPDNINFISMQGGYAIVNTDKERYLTEYNLTKLEKLLDPSRFFRAHRSFIVNLGKVSEIARVGNSAFELIIEDPARTKIPLSRRQAIELRKILNI
ncbi:MAG: response regulator transcription factor [Actinomycetota bacterium]|nr:response regulator transcription factor [Actinomycetota bacterium]